MQENKKIIPLIFALAFIALLFTYENTRRSEAITIINQVEQRPKSYIVTKIFADVQSDYWAFVKIMNAANGYYH